ncbi:site-specific DNA-methyltransferase [Staphylococcus saprophyticus]|nr:site-specific DNA-methyltransferase [Staphylococcus saprophyticus]
MELNKIYNEDCLVGMKKIPDKSIDMILCDLPYGTTANKWDKHIDSPLLWEQYERIIKDDGNIVLTASQPFTTMLINSNIKLFKYTWIWEKDYPTGFAQANHRPMKRHEEIVVFSKAATSAGNNNVKAKYNPQDLVLVNKIKRNGSNRGKVIHEGKIGKDGGFNSTKEYTQKFTNYPQSIIKYGRDKKTIHPTQKPLSLFEYLIKTYTNENDSVLDNCMGSGTTAIACINTNRKYLGFELDEKYYVESLKRINDHIDNKQLNLFECIK